MVLMVVWNPRVIFSNFHSMGRCMQYFGFCWRLCECYGGCHQTNWGKLQRNETRVTYKIQQNVPARDLNMEADDIHIWTRDISSFRFQGFQLFSFHVKELQGCRLQPLWFWESYGSPHEKRIPEKPPSLLAGVSWLRRWIILFWLETTIWICLRMQEGVHLTTLRGKDVFDPPVHLVSRSSHDGITITQSSKPPK